MTGVVGPGLWPGEDILPAQLEIFEDLSQAPTGVTAAPFLAELPQRAAWATRIGRTLAVLEEVPYELGPHGWKLADRGGRDRERAQSLLTQDLEAFAIAGAGFDGPITIDLTGPWTLAAQLYLARGDRALTDFGAVGDLALSLAQGTSGLVAKLHSQLPGAHITIHLHEHLLGQIAAGVLPTFSGYSRIPAVPGPTLVQHLKPVVETIKSSSARVAVNVGDAWVGIAPVVHSEADALVMDFGRSDSWNERGWELIARVVERGTHLWLGLPAPQVSQCSGPNLKSLADTLLVPWHRMGLEPSRLADTVITQSAVAARELYHQGSTAARGSIATLKRVAEHIAESSAQ